MIFVSEPRLSREQNVSWNLFESGRAGGGGEVERPCVGEVRGGWGGRAGGRGGWSGSAE